ncbi:hypothetical protein J3R82DRAFT_8350 [Butyriboletus roseoflavus]|nr:hypothetical protein J3R82DRAFT_8350 [Butyriboletus roseoflavus]
MFDFRAATMLIQRLIQSIRNIPGAILRLLRAILFPIILRGASMVPKVLHLRPSSPAASPTSPRMEYEPSRKGDSYSNVPTSLIPVSSTVFSAAGVHDDPPNNLLTSMPSPAPAPDISLPTQRVTAMTTLSAVPAAPGQIQKYLRQRRKLTYVSWRVLSQSF